MRRRGREHGRVVLGRPAAIAEHQRAGARALGRHRRGARGGGPGRRRGRGRRRRTLYRRGRGRGGGGGRRRGGCDGRGRAALARQERFLHLVDEQLRVERLVHEVVGARVASARGVVRVVTARQ